MNRFSMLMSDKASAKEIAKIVDRLEIEPSGNTKVISTEGLNLAVMQLHLKRYASLAEYVVDMNLYIADAVNRRAQLLCFPAYTGLLPGSLLPQYDAALDSLRPLEDTGLPEIAFLRDCLSDYADWLCDVFYNTMSLLAARHGVYIMAGTTYCFDQHELRHRAFLFGDEGELVGFQDKASLNALERALGMEGAGEIKVFDTALGRLAILIDGDVQYYETARIAKNLGADMLLNPTAFPKEYTPVDTALGLNLRIQENNLYGVQSVLVGETELGFSLEGRSTVFAPNGMLPSKNGVFARSSGRWEPDILTAKINLDKLDQVKNPYLQDTNINLMDKYVDRLF